ncbi:MAG: hypothetical protein ACRDHZ_10840 [Ktedonobacteraceae bacterium]
MVIPPQLSDQERECVRKHLNELLSSRQFYGSRRSTQFLRYVVEEALAGHGLEIKERNIAVDLFSRHNDFDAQQDSIVRVSANEVRRRLANAYKAGLGHVLHIEVPVGSYVPVFHFDGNEDAPLKHKLRHRWWRRLIAAAGIGIAGVMIAIAVLQQVGSRASSLDIFWQPFRHQSLPVLISLPAPTVLTLKHPEKSLSLQAQLEIPASEVTWRMNLFVGTGAALGAARFAEQLTLRHQAFFLKFGTDVSFADLSRSAAILLGAFSSPLSLEIANKLRFRFQTTDKQHCIVDSTQPSRRWCVPRPESTEATKGYALVCRLINTDSGHPILLVAGIGARDTQAAVEFLSNESYFSAFARSAPHGWSHKDCEIVLRNSVHGAVPGIPTIVASYYR